MEARSRTFALGGLTLALGRRRHRAAHGEQRDQQGRARQQRRRRSRRSGSACRGTSASRRRAGAARRRPPRRAARTSPLRTSELTTMASPTYSVQEAAVCPDGKLEVGGAASSCATSGRCLLTIVTVRRNRLNSSVSAKSRKPNCRQWPPQDEHDARHHRDRQDDAGRPEVRGPTATGCSNAAVRSATNQRISLRVHAVQPGAEQDARQQKAQPDDRGPQQDERRDPDDRARRPAAAALQGTCRRLGLLRRAGRGRERRGSEGVSAGASVLPRRRLSSMPPTSSTGRVCPDAGRVNGPSLTPRIILHCSRSEDGSAWSSSSSPPR